MPPLTFDEAVTAAHRLEKYDPSEGRDDHGRWTQGMGPSIPESIDEDVAYQRMVAGLYHDIPRHMSSTFASPSITDKDLPGAVKDLDSTRQKLFEKASFDIDGKLGIPGTQKPVVGAWADGAENSTMLETSNKVPPEALRLSAAMKGALGQQKAVLVFNADKDGPNALYDATVGTPVEETHAALLKAGIPFHTLMPVGAGSTRVVVVDTDGSMGKAVGDFAAQNGTTATRTFGHAEFIGDEKGTGSDAEQRQRAGEAYAKVIASDTSRYQGRRAGELWQGIRDRWGAQISAVKRALGLDDAMAVIKAAAEAA